MTKAASITLDDRGRPDTASARRIIAAIGPVVDAHHHLWDLQSNHYPWLQDRPIKAHFGDYAVIRRDFLPSDFRRCLGPVTLAASVHVEAHWHGGIDPAGESAWLADQAVRHGLPSAIMGAADLRSPDLADILTAHERAPGFRGIRVMAMERGVPEGADLYRDPVFQRGLALVFERGHSVDLQAPPVTHVAVAELAQNFPQGRIAITHGGLPWDRNKAGLALWHDGIARMAEVSNIHLKLSGLPMNDHSWSCDSLAPLVTHLRACFGPSRMMFGSNFPVDGLFSDYPTLLAGYASALGDMTHSDMREVFYGTAQTFYRISPQTTGAAGDAAHV